MRMVKPLSVAIVSVLLTLIPAASGAQVTNDDYQRAEQFHPYNIWKLVFKLSVEPNWIEGTGRFWYMNDTRDGSEFMLVDCGQGTREPAFDHARLAAELSSASGESYQAGKLPFRRIEFSKDGKAIEFRIGEQAWTCDLSDYKCEKAPDPPAGPLESLSPDGRYVAFTRDYNLFVRIVATGEEKQLTFDGCRDYAYATPIPSARTMVQQGTEKVKQDTAVFWSPDSSKLFTYRIDARNAKKLFLIQAIPPDGGVRPKLYTFTYPLPGETTVPYGEAVIFEVERGTRIDVPGVRRPVLYYGIPWPVAHWLGSNKLAFIDFERGWGKISMVEIDAGTGASRVVLEETADTFINGYALIAEYFGDGTEMLLSSERDGWHHLYLYDTRTGELKNQVTSGEWVVRRVIAVDEERRQVYFLAGGREPGRNPYLHHLYRVNLDGSGLTLLTPEDADHEISISPDHKYFVDSFSTVDTPTVSVLRSCEDGSDVLDLEQADISPLLATGWKPPEPFKVKARDGKTDIYGVLYRPTNFDPSKKYPVIDNVYTGPHGATSPNSFQSMIAKHAQSIAELGFIVIYIDGLGTNYRSKAFHDHCYKNLGDGGFPDHIAGIKQLAEKYPYMDIERVGIFGLSAGGYDTVHAICTYPDFYKVAVSASGNYDHRMDKAWWNEVWMDFPVGEHYLEQSCLTIAHQLQGKLMLAHGELDENVNPYNTIRLINKLIEANKDFELLILPHMHHILENNPYFVRKRWDFFVKHLLGVEPPQGYSVQPFEMPQR